MPVVIPSSRLLRLTGYASIFCPGQWQSQDFSLGEGGLVVIWGRRPQLLEAGDLGAKPPAAGGKVVWGRSPKRWAIFAIFNKNNAFLCIFQPK